MGTVEVLNSTEGGRGPSQPVYKTPKIVKLSKKKNGGGGQRRRKKERLVGGGGLCPKHRPKKWENRPQCKGRNFTGRGGFGSALKRERGTVVETELKGGGPPARGTANRFFPGKQKTLKKANK